MVVILNWWLLGELQVHELAQWKQYLNIPESELTV